MPDWREHSDDKEGGSGSSGKEPAKGKSKASNPQQWRTQVRNVIDRKPQTSSAGLRPSESEWNKEDVPIEPISASFWRKWLRFYALLLIFLTTTTGYLVWLFFSRPKLPLNAVWVEKHDKIGELPGVPLGKARNQQIASFEKSRYVDIVFDTDPVKVEQRLVDLGTNREESANGKSPPNSKNPVTAWYFNCYAHWDDQQSELRIYTGQSKSLFEQPDEKNNTIALQAILENLARSVDGGKKRDAYAWAILDLQFPPIAGGLGNLAPKWKTWTQEVLEKINRDHPDLYQRLLVTMPADDGQLSWLAPEYSTSFFGHHLFSLLDSPPKKDWLSRLISSPIKPAEFQDALRERVRNDVISRRFAEQTPVWLPEDNLQRFTSLGLVPGKKPDYKPDRYDPEVFFGQLHPHWEKLEKKYPKAFHWDPLGHARVVSELLGLEEAALYCPQGIERARMRLGKAFKDIYVPQVEFGVSLIEDQQRRQYFGDEQVPPENALDAALWEQKPETAGSGAPQAGESESSSLPVPIDKPQHVWRKLISRATESSQTNDFDLTREKLYQALHWLDPALVEPMNESVNTQPIEIYLLHRLLVDINWLSIVDADQRSKACARALVTFDKLQKLASHPEPEISLAISRKLKSVEEQFLADFDLLLAGQWTKAGAPERDATELFQDVERQLDDLGPTIDAWADAVLASRRTLYLTPHLLGWLLKEYQITDGQQEIEKRLGQLGDAFHRAREIRKKIPKDDWQKLQVEGKELVKLNTELEKAFQDYVRSKTEVTPTAVAGTSPQTFRRNLIALQTSLLTSHQRQELHRQVQAFLRSDPNVSGTSGGTDETDSKPPSAESSDVQKALNIFLAKLRGASGDPSDALPGGEPLPWSELGQEDARYRLFQRLSQSTAQVSDLGGTSDLSTPSPRMLDDPGLRSWAAFLGNAPSLIANKKQMELVWPANLMWRENELKRCIWQVKRLTDAGWGHGEIPELLVEPEIRQQFYFWRLSERYLRLLEDTGLVQSSVAGQGSSTSGRIDKIKERMTEKAKQLSSIRVKIGKERQSRGTEKSLKVPVEIEIQSPSWESATASVYLVGDPGERLRWTEFDNGSNDSALAFPLKVTKQKQDVEIATDRWESGIPSGTLALRGNYRTQQLNWPAPNDSSIEVQFERPQAKDAVVEIRNAEKPPQISFALLVDCSESMKKEIADPKEGAQDNFAPAYKVVHSHIKKVLYRLKELHKNGSAKISVCVIPFGVKRYDELTYEVKNFLVKERKTLDLNTRLDQSSENTGHLYSTVLKDLDDQWVEDLESLIDNLKPQKNTPLYSAIVEAYGQLSTPGSSKRPFIYVFSDGENEVDENTPYMKHTEKDVIDIAKNIVRSDGELRVFHYSHSNSVKDKIATGDLFNNGKNETDQNNSPNTITYDKPDNPALLAEKTVQTLPRPEYSLTLIPQSKSNQPSKCNLSPKIESGIVEFQVPRNCIGDLYQRFQVSAKSISGKSAVKEILLTGGEKIKLTFETRADAKLDFPLFEPAEPNKGWLKLPNSAKDNSDAIIPYDLWLYNDRLKYLSFKCAIRNKIVESFTESPRFAVGLLEPHASSAAQAIPLADFSLEPEKHYPEIRFSQVPWDGKKFPKARLSVWIASAPIGDKATKDAGGRALNTTAGETKEFELGPAGIEVKRAGETLTVKVSYSQIPERENRVLVLCTSAQKAYRKYQELAEEHRFTLPKAVSFKEDVQIQFLTVSALNKLVVNGDLSRFDLEDAPVGR